MSKVSKWRRWKKNYAWKIVTSKSRWVMTKDMNRTIHSFGLQEYRRKICLFSRFGDYVISLFIMRICGISWFLNVRISQKSSIFKFIVQIGESNCFGTPEEFWWGKIWKHIDVEPPLKWIHTGIQVLVDCEKGKGPCKAWERLLYSKRIEENLWSISMFHRTLLYEMKGKITT